MFPDMIFIPGNYPVAVLSYKQNNFRIRKLTHYLLNRLNKALIFFNRKKMPTPLRFSYVFVPEKLMFFIIPDSCQVWEYDILKIGRCYLRQPQVKVYFEVGLQGF